MWCEHAVSFRWFGKWKEWLNRPRLNMDKKDNPDNFFSHAWTLVSDKQTYRRRLICGFVLSATPVRQSNTEGLKESEPAERDWQLASRHHRCHLVLLARRWRHLARAFSYLCLPPCLAAFVSRSLAGDVEGAQNRRETLLSEANKTIRWMNRIACHVISCVELVIRVHLAFINHLHFLPK